MVPRTQGKAKGKKLTNTQEEKFGYTLELPNGCINGWQES
jgi:hypothetical protein